MSEIKTLDVEVSFPDILDVDVDFGQTLTKIVAPEHYMGPFEFYPSDEDQVIPVKDKTPVEDICVKGITGEKTITQNGTYNTLEDKTVTVDVIGILDRLLEVVSSVTPEQEAQTLEFPCDKKTGMYFIVSNPPGTRAFAAQRSWNQTINATVFEIRGSAEIGVWTQPVETLCFKKKTDSNGEVDWWAAKTTKTENGVNVTPTSGRYPFLAGVTYYLLRVKGV